MIRITIFFFILQSSIVFAQQANNEFRATWVITWEHIDQYKNPGQNMEKIRKIMEDHKAANMNAVSFKYAKVEQRIINLLMNLGVIMPDISILAMIH